MLQTTAVGEFVEELAAEVLIQTGVVEPPVDAFEVARALGMEIVRSRSQNERGRLVSSGRHQTIVVRPEPRPERSQWTVAHEVGEFVIPQWADRWSDEFGPLDSSMREWLANRFASVLLAPRTWFLRDAARLDHDLWALKNRYRTASFEVLAQRLLDSDVPSVVSIFDNDRLVRRLGNLATRPPSPLDFENRCRREAARTGKPIDRTDEFVRVQAWPIHEPEWRREILRTEPRWLAAE